MIPASTPSSDGPAPENVSHRSRYLKYAAMGMGVIALIGTILAVDLNNANTMNMHMTSMSLDLTNANLASSATMEADDSLWFSSVQMEQSECGMTLLYADADPLLLGTISMTQTGAFGPGNNVADINVVWQSTGLEARATLLRTMGGAKSTLSALSLECQGTVQVLVAGIIPTSTEMSFTKVIDPKSLLGAEPILDTLSEEELAALPFWGVQGWDATSSTVMSKMFLSGPHLHKMTRVLLPGATSFVLTVPDVAFALRDTTKELTQGVNLGVKSFSVDLLSGEDLGVTVYAQSIRDEKPAIIGAPLLVHQVPDSLKMWTVGDHFLATLIDMHFEVTDLVEFFTSPASTLNGVHRRLLAERATLDDMVALFPEYDGVRVGLDTNDANLTFVLEVDLFNMGNSSFKANWDFETSFPENSTTLISGQPFAELFLFEREMFSIYPEIFVNESMASLSMTWDDELTQLLNVHFEVPDSESVESEQFYQLEGDLFVKQICLDLSPLPTAFVDIAEWLVPKIQECTSINATLSMEANQIYSDVPVYENEEAPVDCKGEEYGNAYFDTCGRCINPYAADDPFDLNFNRPCCEYNGASCEYDCNFRFGGGATVNSCGQCVGPYEASDCRYQCNGEFVVIPTHYLDVCNQCIGPDYHNQPCWEQVDCAGNVGGQWIVDDCGECVERQSDGCDTCLDSSACNYDWHNMTECWYDFDPDGNCVGGNFNWESNGLNITFYGDLEIPGWDIKLFADADHIKYLKKLYQDDEIVFDVDLAIEGILGFNDTLAAQGVLKVGDVDNVTVEVHGDHEFTAGVRTETSSTMRNSTVLWLEATVPVQSIEITIYGEENDKVDILGDAAGAWVNGTVDIDIITMPQTDCTWDP
jgi:hypothetical protein